MQQNLETLLKRWKDGALTKEELIVLKDMLRSEKHEQEYDSILTNGTNSEQQEYQKDASASFERTYKAVVEQIDAHENRTRFRLGNVVAIAASIVLLIAAGIWMFRSNVGETTTFKTTVGVYSGKQFIKLPDGTAVTLNDGSSLIMSGEFGQKTREVTLAGEAFFDVAYIPNRPFIVRTQDVNTTVLGTAFNIKAYKNQTNVTVTVMRGKVIVGHANDIFGNLLPNEEITVNTSSLEYAKKKVNAERAVNWKSEYLILDNITMLEAARLISEHFKTKVSLGGNKNLEQCHVTAYFLKGEPLKTVISSVCLAKGLDYSIQGQSVTITGTCK